MSKLNYFIRSGLYSICVLVLLMEGLEGFFIKHSETGLCLKPTDNPFGKGNWGAQFYAQFYDQCLHPDAQFRFTDEHYVHNIGKNGTFFARSEPKYLQRFIVYTTFAVGGFVRKVNFRLNQKKSGSLSVYNGSYCATPEYLEKPYKRYNLIRTTTCDQDLQKFTFGSVTNYSETMNDVNCASSQVIDVMKAEFGVFSNGLSFVYDSDTMCSSFALCVVKAYCDRKNSCNMSADDNLFKLSQCPKTSRQLYVEHNCVDTPGVTITTVSKIRLSDLPYRGSIEVNNGTTWIKANDKTWDKEKEVALCHHLGYMSTKSNSAADHVTIGAGQRLASGDLYCYGTQTNSTSCCAQLVPTTSGKESKIPFVHCQVCKEPLLQDISKFPNSVFSASDLNGYKSRLSSNGWCPTNVEPKYLQIDLQKEYYISHIATFGDKAQTKWLESYSLQYSSTLGGLSSSWIKMITANRDAYRASIINLNYAYARYLRIIPKLQREAFCIRVQLCGAPVRPVQTVVIRNITARSVHVSWSLPPNEGHSDATYFLISLNGNTKKQVSRSGDRNQYTLNDLKPYTNYEVTISAGNANGVSESVSKLFKTTVQPPDPVQNVLYSSAPSVRVSWSLPQNEQQSHVTYFLVSLSGTGLKHNVSRKDNSNQYTFIDLKLHNTYTVTIEAGNPYGVGEVVSGTFTTNEAAALQSETSEDRFSKTAFYVVISILSVIIAVLAVVLMGLYFRRSKSQHPAGANNNPLSERVYENVENPRSSSDENIRGDTSSNVYQNVDQSLTKPDDDDNYESMDPIEIKK